jgi:hypothetical protein
MGGIVIANQVKLPIRQDDVVDQAEKLEPLLVPMTLLAQAKDFAVGRIQRGKLEWRCRCVCSRASWSRRVRLSAARWAGYDPELEFGSSRRRTAPARALAG